MYKLRKILNSQVSSQKKFQKGIGAQPEINMWRNWIFERIWSPLSKIERLTSWHSSLKHLKLARSSQLSLRETDLKTVRLQPKDLVSFVVKSRVFSLNQCSIFAIWISLCGKKTCNLTNSVKMAKKAVLSFLLQKEIPAVFLKFIFHFVLKIVIVYSIVFIE